MPRLHEIKIGCCGWSYDDWKGALYPSSAKAGDYLGLYAKHFDIVEVDSTFYRIPSKRMVESWRERTPDGFRFTLKLPHVITHENLLQDCDEELEAFASAARLLGEKLACVCLQFGYFNRKKFASLRLFLEVLDRFLCSWPPDITPAIEIRNRNWIGPQWIEFLYKHRATMVLTQQSWMPPPAQLIDKFDVASGPLGYVRLLGDRKGIEEITTTWSKTVIDKTDEIRATANAITQLARSVPVMAFCNNHYAGYGPATAEMLRECIFAAEGD